MNIQTISCGILIFFFLILKFSACTSNNETGDKQVITKASPLWLGSWIRNEYQNPGKLDIIHVSNDSIQFELHASSGGHESGLEGIAIATDTAIAIFSSKEKIDSCKIEFRLVGDTIIVKQVGNKCLAATGVMYDGKYNNEDNLIFEDGDEQNKTLLDLEIFITKNQDSIFRSLVGGSYSLFVNSTQLTSEDDDLDSMNTVVKSSGIRGLFTLMENIIMIDSVNNIWAAVINDKQKVLYFTNSKVYKNKLPKTIDNWRRNFMEYPVIFNQ
jgi:hypothetical protein